MLSNRKCRFFIFFFSTVAYNLKNEKWGTKFSIIMNELYLSELNSSHIPVAINKLRQIKQGLTKYSFDKVVRDIQNSSAQPPWETTISDTITDLSNYFITIFNHALLKAEKLKITSI
ncbi:Imm70 family immunity protein [Amedibacillus dolichus]|nr:Imm70 family immunity protein [Amedibacillus dolichus]MCB5372722.1 immunity 70 family protein [Amedibacillus dolichus]